MTTAWDEAEASKFEGAPGPLIYTAHLLGQEESFGVTGGGTISMKTTARNLLGEEEEILIVDNGIEQVTSLGASGFTPVRCKPLAGLAHLERLSAEQLANELACNRTLATTPIPTINTLLHAALPYKVVFFTRPDALMAVSSTPNGLERLQEIYAKSVLAVPYAPSGLALAKACLEALKSGADSTQAIFIHHQGLVTFGDSTRQAYECLVKLVSQAENYLKHHGAFHLNIQPANPDEKPLRQELAVLRKDVSAAAGYPLILTVNSHPAMLSLSRRDDLPSLVLQGPAAAGDAGLLRCLPLIGRDVESYRAANEQAYTGCFPGQASPGFDFAPRIIFDPAFGMSSLGRTAAEARLAGERYLHTIDIGIHAAALGSYQTLSQKELFEAVSTGETPLSGAGPSALFAGEVALVTGGASGIGKACVESLLARGAAVVSMDINPKVQTMYSRPDYLGLECNLTNENAVLQAFEALGRAFGGLDMLVLNAGIFPAGVRIESLELMEWQKVMRINLDSNLVVLREAYPLLKHAPKSGRVLVNASKNVLAPGVGAAAYSSSKAAVTQLARVAALEWGKDRIRVNMIHPDAIFDTGIWTEEVLKARAVHYGLTVQQYKTRNVLGVELNSHYVGELVAEMLGPRFEKITGAQIPVDGGSDRVI